MVGSDIAWRVDAAMLDMEQECVLIRKASRSGFVAMRVVDHQTLHSG